MKEKTTIQIDHNILKSILKGFVLAFLTVFAVEHFSTFSYIPNLNIPNIDSNGKIILSQTYDPTTTPVGALYQTTTFGTKIDLPINGIMCSDLLYDSDFKRYSNKGVLYAKSVFRDYKYLLLFWLAYTLIVLFFKRYRLKVLILILPILGINCRKSKHETLGDCIRHIDTVKTTSNIENTQGLQKTNITAINN
ncbi:hypothetical protein [Chryseobacterium sp. MYb7]|uniref:hypothetical protein n=1 Tax=Chryseobacterium sp. MYb7 TaxID=1827290 RepID=UPI00160F79A1|nr:hypothetical protein [Chryseobacterium sp. MYb7]